MAGAGTAEPRPRWLRRGLSDAAERQRSAHAGTPEDGPRRGPSGEKGEGERDFQSRSPSPFWPRPHENAATSS